MKKIKIALFIQFAFFAIWGAWLLITYGQVKANFWLETRPIDPRDILSGNFIQLNYDIENPKAKSCSQLDTALKKSNQIYVRLVPKEHKELKDGRKINIMTVDTCLTKPSTNETNNEALWLTAKMGICENTDENFCLKYENLNRYYMNERDSRLKQISGKIAVNVQLNKKNKLKIIDIADIGQ